MTGHIRLRASAVHAAVLVCVAAVCTSAAPQSDGPARDTRPLRFVGDHAYAPVSFEQNGVPAGIDANLVQLLSRAMRRPIQFEVMDFDEALKRVLDGRADGVTDVGVLAERRQQFDFSEPIVTHEFVFYTRRGDASVAGVADLVGKRVEVSSTAFAGAFLAGPLGYMPPSSGSLDSAFPRLVSGDVDVLAVDNWVAAPVARQYASQVRLVGTPFATVATAIAFRKGDPNIDAVNQAIRAIKADGSLSRVEESWRPPEMLFLPQLTVRRWALWTGVILAALTLAGLAVWIAALRREVRARKRVAAALAVSEQKFALTFRASPDSITLTDAVSGALIDVNERFELQTGYSRSEVIGRSASEAGMISETEALAFRDMVRRLGSVRDVELHRRRKDGTLGTVLSSAELIDLDGRPALLTVHRDITAAREVEAQLRQAQKMEAVGRLAAGVAHDFNNLLTVILGNAEEALADATDGVNLRARLSDVRDAAERATSLTRQLLAFSRRQIIQATVVDLNAAVAGVQQMLGRLVGEHVEVRFALAPQPLFVRADVGALQQIVMNLAVNARDAMPVGGRLTIATSATGADLDSAADPALTPAPRVVMTVSDTGIGMDRTTRERAFEPFFSTKGPDKGTGLGLATVYALVTGAGGTVSVESDIGRGTTFTVSWPRADAPVSQATEEQPRAIAAGGPETIWLVEDAAPVRTLLRDALVRAGYAVHAAGNGAEALALAAAGITKPQLLITDVIMPGMNGRQLAETLCTRYPTLKVLYVSGYANDAMLRPGVGGANMLIKPFVPATLLARVREILDELQTSESG